MMSNNNKSPTSSSSRKCNTRNRSVRLAPRTQIFLVPHLSDFTDEEISSAYTTDQDSKASQQDVVNTIRGMRSRNQHSSDQHCSRGLERMASPQTMEEARLTKERVYDAVLDEQDRQFDEGFYDEASIAEASRKNSKLAAENALMLAAIDAAYVNRNVRPQEEEEETRTTSSQVLDALPGALVISSLSALSSPAERNSRPQREVQRRGAHLASVLRRAIEISSLEN